MSGVKALGSTLVKIIVSSVGDKVGLKSIKVEKSGAKAASEDEPPVTAGEQGTNTDDPEGPDEEIWKETDWSGQDPTGLSDKATGTSSPV